MNGNRVAGIERSNNTLQPYNALVILPLDQHLRRFCHWRYTHLRVLSQDWTNAPDLLLETRIVTVDISLYIADV